MKRLVCMVAGGLALALSGCEVSDRIVGQAVDCGIEAADSVAGELIIPDGDESVPHTPRAGQ